MYQPLRSGAHRAFALLLCCALFPPASVLADEPEYQVSPRAFVRKAIGNEVTSQNDNSRYMWRQESRRPKGSVTKLMIETNECVISRTIAWDGRPLSTEDRAKDDARVSRLLTDGNALRKKKQEQQEDSDRANTVLRAIPDAFIFTYHGTENGAGSVMAHYTFEPDPKFDPPNRETMVLQGMKGDLYVDTTAARIVKIDAILFKDVEFGWGILGRLFKGGHFLIEQRRIEAHRWETTHSVLSFTGKILFFKSLNIQQDEIATDFRRVPQSLTIAEGIDYLKKADDVVAQNGGGTTK